jgi:hypothetical protein
MQKFCDQFGSVERNINRAKADFGSIHNELDPRAHLLGNLLQTLAHD